MQSAVDSLAKTEPAAAQPPMEKALDSLKKELDAIDKKEAEARTALNQDRFAGMRKEQAGNRSATEDVNEQTRQLGSSGTSVESLSRRDGKHGGPERLGQFASQRRQWRTRAGLGGAQGG